MRFGPPGPAARTSPAARTAMGLEVVLGTSALYGAEALARDRWHLDLELLAPLPFRSWVLPGVALATVIGAPMLAAAAAEHRRRETAPVASAACGAVLAGWIGLQLRLGGWSQPPVQVFCLASAGALLVLRAPAALRVLRSRRSP